MWPAKNPYMNKDNLNSNTENDTFYTTVQTQYHLPNAACNIINHNYAIFRDMYLVLDLVEEQIRTSGFTPAQITIYADVLLVTKDTRWPLPTRGLFIFARHIELTGTAEMILYCNHTATARLVLFADTISGTLPVKLKQQEVIVLEKTLTPEQLRKGIALTYTAGQIKAENISRHRGMTLQLPGDMLLCLTHSYIIVCLLYKTNPPFYRAVLDWVNSWTTANNQLQELHLRCAALLSPSMQTKLLQAVWQPPTINATADSADKTAYPVQFRQQYLYLFSKSIFTHADIALVQQMITDLPGVSQSAAEEQAQLADAMQQNKQQLKLLAQNLEPGEKPILALMQRLFLHWLDVVLLEIQ